MGFNAPAKRSSEIRTLRGTEKVAVLLLAMGRELSGNVLKEFAPEEIRLVTRAAAELKPISAGELESIIEEFAQNFSTGPNIFGTVGELEKLLNGVLPPDQVTDIISEVLATRPSRYGKESRPSPRACSRTTCSRNIRRRPR
jgi:flagellar motor switch protein FliG